MGIKLVFVHGLGGSSNETWGDFPKLIESSEDMDCDVSFYEYPTRVFRIPFFQSKYGSIQDLARGLRTFIENKFDANDNIVLVGHSLGGLIIRKYLLDEKIRGADIRIHKVILYAVPHTGSSLANVGNFLSFKHRQLKQLCKDSDFLDQLNDSWAESKIDELLDVKCVIGLGDNVVDRESLKGFCRTHSIETIPDQGHIDIVKPRSVDDMSFVILKKFINEDFPIAKTGLRGALSFKQWGEMDDVSQFEFMPDEKRRSYILSIRELITQPKQCIRIIGLSGLGKTRMAFEVFRYELDKNEELTKKVLYIDMANGFDDLPVYVADWVSKRFTGILVLDNCDIEDHMRVAKQIRRDSSKLCLISLDYNPDEDPESKVFKLDRLSDELIKNMLEPVYGKHISADLGRIVEFAQGFPQMAVLLSKARLNQVEDMGRLADTVLIRKMLWGNDSPDMDSYEILLGCALFDKFGLDETAATEYKFIADIIGVDEQSFYSCVKRFKRRGVFDQRGRYVQLVPKPLAIYLAAEWWDKTLPEKQEALVMSKMPGQLEASFCEQIKRLDFLKQVRELTASICGPMGPFGQAEVILSDRGSYLFRALVEVNPEATSDALYRILEPMDRPARLRILGNVRRNLVWALEKLCFRRDVFEKSAMCMLWLASAENENWSNNATGEFTNLFRVFISGTEAEPKKRLAVLDNAISTNDPSIQDIAVDAMGAAIDVQGGFRTVGAEYQGSGKALEEWRPTIWKDAFDYWDEILHRLTEIALGGSEIGSKAKNTIANHIRGLVARGRIKELDKAIKRIVKQDGALWPGALESIKHSISYDSDKIPKEGREKLDEWTELLTPKELVDQLSLIVSVPPYEHEKGKDGQYIDIAAINAEALAKQLSSNVSVLLPCLYQLLVGEQRKAYWFALALVRYSHHWEPLLSEAISYLETATDKPNPSFMYGLLNGVAEINPETWESYMSRLGGNVTLAKYYPSALTTGDIRNKHLRHIIKLVQDGQLPVNELVAFTFGRALDDVDDATVISFVSDLKELSAQAAWMSLDILSMYCHGSIAKRSSCAATFESILTDLPLIKVTGPQTLDYYHWSEAARSILDNNNRDFAKKLAKKIVDSCGDQINYGDLRHYVQPVMKKLLSNYGAEVWPIIAEAIQGDDTLKQYRLDQLLSTDDIFDRKSDSVLSSLDEQILLDWCRANPKFAPEFVGRTVEIFIDRGDEYELSSKFRFLIDEFGDDKNVVSELFVNMGSFGWSGSVVPILRKEVAVLTPLLDHPTKAVRDWINDRISDLNKRIEIESQRDDEESWGIR